MSDTEYLRICPHCGNKTILELKSTIIEVDTVKPFGDDGPSELINIQSYVLQCRTCGEVSLYRDWNFQDEPTDVYAAKQLYPGEKNLVDVPQAIRDSYFEAKKVEKNSPTAFAVLIRRALEYLCKDKEASGRNLKEQIDDLALKEVIPKTLARMAGALRYFGNLGAHSTDTKIGIQEAEMMDDFFIAVIEYVYIAPGKLKKLEESLKKTKVT